MRFLNFNAINSASAAANTTSSPIDMNQIFKMSAQVSAPSGTLSVSVQLQVSNDSATGAQPFGAQTFTNWSNLGSAAALNAAGSVLIAQQDMCYRALRAVVTDTFNNVSTITTIGDFSDSLNGTYFLASSVTANYYFWFDSGTAVDPAIAGRTGIHVTYTTNDTAATLGGLVRSAAAGKGWTVTGSTATAVLTNSATGPTTIASDGVLATNFTISNTQPTANVTVNLMCQGV
jgi:hypothetical protein